MPQDPDSLAAPDNEVAAARLAELGLTAAVVAHDFNNALTIILGSTSMLRAEGGLTPAQVVELDSLEGAARYGTELVRQLLSHARRTPLREGPTDVNAVLTQMDWMLRHMGRRKVSVELLLTPGLGPVKAGAIHLEQIVLNLTANAAAVLHGGGQIILHTSSARLPNGDERTRALLKAGDYVRLSVSDNGLGMSADVQERLFLPFYTTKKDGSGLGLFSVRDTVRRCGGEILVTSWLGEGTTFEVYLPVWEA